MTFVPSKEDLLIYGFKPSRSKRRLSKNGVIFHVPTRKFYVDGIDTNFDDEAQFLRFVSNRTKHGKSS
jgi:hypothetical protein